MALAVIRSASTAGTVTGQGRNNLVIGQLVTLTDTNGANAGQPHVWELADRPIGSAAVLSGAATETATFTPDVTGSYRIKCTVNSELTFAEVVIAVPLPNTGIRIPSFLEKLQYNGGGNTKGWHEAMTVAFRAVDTLLASVGGGGPPTGAAGGDLTGTYPNPSLAAVGTAGTHAYPASITVDSKGRVTSVTPGSAPASVYYQTIEANGVTRPQQPKINFKPVFTAVDTPGSTRTDIDIATNGITAAMFRQSAAVSVVGNPGASLGNVADITATAHGVLRSNAANNALSFGLLTTDNLASNASVLFSQLQNLAGLSLLAKATAGAGAPAALTATTDGQIPIYNGTAIVFGQLRAGSAAGTTTNGFVLKLSAGVPTWLAESGGGVTGTGTVKKLAIWTGAGTLGPSTVTMDSTATIAAGQFVVDPDNTATRTFGLTSYAGTTGIPAGLVFHAPTLGASEFLTFLPDAGGTAGKGFAFVLRDTSAAAWKQVIKGENRAGIPHLQLLQDGGLLGIGSTFTPTVDLHLSKSASGAAVSALLHNTSNTATSSASMEVRVAGNLAANPRYRLNIDGVRTVDSLIDNADADAWKLQVDGVTFLKYTTSAGNPQLLVNRDGGSSSWQGSIEVWRPDGYGTLVAVGTGTGNYSSVSCYNQGANVRTEIVQCGTVGNTYGNFLGSAMTGFGGLVQGGGAGLKIGTFTAVPVIMGTDNKENIRIDEATGRVKLTDHAGNITWLN